MTMMGKGRIMVFTALALVAGTLNGCQTTDGGTIASSAATPEDGANWMRVGRTDNEDHFSPLTQINDGNVGELGLAWSHDLATFNSFTAPLAVDGVLYFATGYSVLHAMDAATGKLLWTYDPEAWQAAGHKMRAGWGIRGIAYDNGKLFAGTIGGQLIAVDARTGKPQWSVQTVDKENSAYITGAPWVFRGKVMIGFGGADYGPVRGYVTAYDQATGKQAWRFHTVPGDPSKGFENKAMEMAARTWTGEWWKFGGGGNVWGAMAYDPKYNRVYLGTGNGWPWNQKIRSPGGGDNLFLSSIIALDADTGEYVWHYQVNPGNSWDFNNAMDIELADLEIDGKMHSVLLHAPKNGFFYVIDRATGKLLSAEKFAKVNWADRIDLQTGRPVENPEARYPGGKPFLMYPWPLGAHGVQAMSFSPRTGLVYLPATDAGRVFVDPAGDLSKWQYKPGMFVNTGLGAPPPGITSPPPESKLVAWDPVAQKARWSVPQNGSFNGGTMATAGNLVFQGLNTGHLVAYAADTGRKVWEFDAQNGILGHPITYTAHGRQYITVITGWRSSFAGKPNWDYETQQRRVLTFMIGGKAKLPPFQPAALPIQDDPEFKIDPELTKVGSGIYNSSCVICHGAGMVGGGAAPDLRKAAAPLSFETFDAVVRGGALRSNGMPQFDNLTEREAQGVQHYIRQRARESLAAK